MKVEAWNITALGSSIVGNLDISEPVAAYETCLNLSSQFPYVPVICTAPLGHKTYFLDGEICPEYTEKTDLMLKGDNK